MIAAAGAALAGGWADPALPWLALWAVLAGVVRGISGFGAALVFMPAAAGLVGPTTAAPTLWVMDALGGLALIPWAARRAEGRAVLRLGGGLVCGVPLGIWALTAAPADALRWGVSLAALGAFGAVAAGWRWIGPLPRGAEAGVGLLSGFGGGVAGLGGVAPVLFYLGRAAGSERLRANIVMLFCIGFPLSGLGYAAAELFQARAVGLGLLLMPVYALAVRGGMALYPHVSERAFRRGALGLVAASALAGAPLWD